MTGRARQRFENGIEDALGQPHPLLVLQLEGGVFSETFARLLPEPLLLARLDREMAVALFEQTLSATGRIDREMVMPLLPPDAALARLARPGLLAALRSPSAADAARRLSALSAAKPAGRGGGLTLAEIGGTSPAHRAAEAMVADLADWRDGRARWSEMSRSLLLPGAPGTGKTVLAKAIARSADTTLIEGGFGDWQSHGHLGDMLREMGRSFDAACAAAPSILFIDEIDSAGSRFDSDPRSRSYRRRGHARGPGRVSLRGGRPDARPSRFDAGVERQKGE